MNPTGRYTTQQWIKIIEAYFATKSVLLTQQQSRRDFGRNNVHDRRTIQPLVVKFRETGSVVDAHKGHSGRNRSAIIPENIQNLREILEESPRNQHAVSHVKLALPEHQFWGSSIITLSYFLTKFRSCRGKLITIKQNEKHFVKISVKGLKMTLVCCIWFSLVTRLTVTWVGTSTSRICTSGSPYEHTHHPLSQEKVTVWCVRVA